MKEAAERLARSRQAIVEHIHRSERHHDPREHGEPAARQRRERAAADEPWQDVPPPRGAGWPQQAMHALRSWWHYHPANMAMEFARPMLHGYGRRKPVQMLAIAAAAGGLLMFMRPWRLISISAVVVALLKSPQVMGLLMSAFSAADFEKDQDRPE